MGRSFSGVSAARLELESKLEKEMPYYAILVTMLLRLITMVALVLLYYCITTGTTITLTMTMTSTVTVHITIAITISITIAISTHQHYCVIVG